MQNRTRLGIRPVTKFVPVQVGRTKSAEDLIFTYRYRLTKVVYSHIDSMYDLSISSG
jgi:hypothetical protein